MKKTIIGIAIIAITATSCNNSGTTSADTKKDDTTKVNHSMVKNTESKVDGAMVEMVSQYLKIKNALTNDNGKEAANAANAFVESMGKMETTSLGGDKKKTWDNIADDAKEMAEHIGKNAGKLDHQREHFDMLSKDMYDMVKAFGAGQTLYQDFCPMYNDNKGATWLSETKEIKNPYLGTKMPTCGSVKEEIK